MFHFSFLDLSPLTNLKGFKMIKIAESGIAENLDFSAALSFCEYQLSLHFQLVLIPSKVEKQVWSES